MIVMEVSTIALSAQQPSLDVTNILMTDSVATVAKTYVSLKAEEEERDAVSLNK